jgi:hypothetical protein
VGRFENIANFSVIEKHLNDLEDNVQKEFVENFSRTYYPFCKRSEVEEALKDENPIVYESTGYSKRKLYSLEPWGGSETLRNKIVKDKFK